MLVAQLSKPVTLTFASAVLDQIATTTFQRLNVPRIALRVTFFVQVFFYPRLLQLSERFKSH